MLRSEDLAADADLTQHTLVAFFMHRIGMHFTGARFAVQHDARWRFAAIQLKARTVVVQIDECASALLRDTFK